MGNQKAQHYLINGRNLYVELYGQSENPPVVFLHQGLGSTYSWKLHIQAFTDAGYYIVVYDRWGYGKSDARHSLITNDFKEDLSDLEALLEVLNIHRVALIGHSDGGTIALYYAALHPDNVACLIAISAHIYIEERMKPSIIRVRQSFNENAWFRDALNRLHGEKTSLVFSNWYNGWLNVKNLDWDMRPIIRRITCPTLVVQGDDDEHASPKHAQDIVAEIPTAELWMPPGAGHLFPQDNPEIFNPKILSFLSEHYDQ